MTKRALAVAAVVVSVSTLIGARGPVAAQSGAGAKPPDYPGYGLVWSDEFNRDGEPDPKNWT